jgi:hypothetical protein
LSLGPRDMLFDPMALPADMIYGLLCLASGLMARFVLAWVCRPPGD